MSDSREPTVLLPGGGGAAAISALKSLRLAGFRGRIVSTDIDRLAPAIFLADVGATLPPSTDPRFFGCALELIEREGISLILPTSGFDILVYSERKAELRRRGVTAIVSEPEAVETCVDKIKFSRRANERFPLPRTVLPGPAREVADAVGLPCIVKPVLGKGGREIALCRTLGELAENLASRPEVLVQEFLPGDEYSIDVLSDLEGEPLVAVPRVRLKTDGGVSVRGRVFHDAGVQRVCMDLARFLGLKGPSCMQMRHTASGEPKFLEVNPRMGGATIFSALAGVNLAQLQVDLAAGGSIEIPPFRDLTVVRYYEEVAIEG